MAKIMHRLILMRHAQAETSAPSGGGDEARPLSAAGRAEALLMGRALAERGLKPDLALVSSAVRTRQTWEQMHDAFGDVEVREEAALYNAGSDVIRRFVENSEDEAGCLLILAHNPGVHVLAAEGMTLILVTHEMNFAREVGDRVVFMHQGKVWEQGDSKTLFANPQTTELKQFISSVRGLN